MMEETQFDRLLAQRREQQKAGVNRYQRFGLKNNPFPKSGTANINSSESYTGLLNPIDENVVREINNYVVDSIVPSSQEDKFLSATIVGDYGTGKTQLLLYAKYLLHKASDKTYVIYIDNPGVKLSELIGAVIDKVGEENFKKFIWNKVIDRLAQQPYRNKFKKYEYRGSSLFGNENPDPFAEENCVNYRVFIDVWLKYLNTKRQQQDFKKDLQYAILEILETQFLDAVVAQYFYDLISEDYGINQAWELLITGGGKHLDNKEVQLLNSIIEIVKSDGYENFYILVDEFEDITRGRLSKNQTDNYLYNLRTLIDKNRQWCVLFAMTGTALRHLRTSSPPLADRISNREIILSRMEDKQAKILLTNYLNLAREAKEESVHPFSENLIEYLNNRGGGIARIFLKNCYYLLERAVDEQLEGGINKKFAESHLTNI